MKVRCLSEFWSINKSYTMCQSILEIQNKCLWEKIEDTLSILKDFSSYLQRCTDLLKMVYIKILLNFGNIFYIKILEFSFRNCVSSLLCTHYSAFLLKAISAQKLIWTPTFYYATWLFIEVLHRKYYVYQSKFEYVMYLIIL